MSKIKENASGAASSAGGIAATTAPVGKKKKGKKQETIFAMSAEDRQDIDLIRRRAGLSEQGELVPRGQVHQAELADKEAIEDHVEEIQHGLEHLAQMFMYIENVDDIRHSLPGILESMKELEVEMLKLKKFVG